MKNSILLILALITINSYAANEWNSYEQVVADGLVMRPGLDAHVALPFGSQIYTVGRLGSSIEWRILFDSATDYKIISLKNKIKTLIKNDSVMSRVTISTTQVSSNASIVVVAGPYYEPIDELDPYVLAQIFFVTKSSAEMLFTGNVFSEPKIILGANGDISFKDAGPHCSEPKKYAADVQCNKETTHSLKVSSDR